MIFDRKFLYAALLGLITDVLSWLTFKINSYS